MSSYNKNKLSGSTNGRAVEIAAIVTPGTVVHTARAVTGASFDEIWLWATNTSSSAVVLTFEFGGTGAANNITVTIPPTAGMTPCLPGLILQNSLALAAFAGVTNVINLVGYVNEIG